MLKVSPLTQVIVPPETLMTPLFGVSIDGNGSKLFVLIVLFASAAESVTTS
jgi:hypothetical protein